MKLFLILILLSLFIFLGIFVYLYYLYRNKLFVDLNYITKSLKNNISFNKDNLNVLITNAFEVISPTSKFILKNHNHIVTKILCKNEKTLIMDFFKSLGKGDIDYEINNLKYYENTFENIEKLSKNDVKNKGLLYLKLIIGIGLIVCIIVI